MMEEKPMEKPKTRLGSNIEYPVLEKPHLIEEMVRNLEALRLLLGLRSDNIFLRAKVRAVLFVLISERNKNYIEMLQYLNNYNESHWEKIEISKMQLKKINMSL